MLVCVVSCSWLWMLLCGIDAVAEGGNDNDVVDDDSCRLLSMRGWLVGCTGKGRDDKRRADCANRK